MFFFFCIICGNQYAHLFGDLCGLCSKQAAYGVEAFFIISYGKPILRESVVPFFNVRCRSLMNVSVMGRESLSIIILPFAQ